MDFAAKVELIRNKFLFEIKSEYYHKYEQAYQWQNWDHVFVTFRNKTNGRLVTVYLKGEILYPRF
jgi:hypothetical protein